MSLGLKPMLATLLLCSLNPALATDRHNRFTILGFSSGMDFAEFEKCCPNLEAIPALDAIFLKSLGLRNFRSPRHKLVVTFSPTDGKIVAISGATLRYIHGEVEMSFTSGQTMREIRRAVSKLLTVKTEINTTDKGISFLDGENLIIVSENSTVPFMIVNEALYRRINPTSPLESNGINTGPPYRLNSISK